MNFTTNIAFSLCSLHESYQMVISAFNYLLLTFKLKYYTLEVYFMDGASEDKVKNTAVHVCLKVYTNKTFILFCLII